MNEKMELRPCPFCGGTAEIHEQITGIIWVECGQCGINTKAASSKLLAIEKWNHRIDENEEKQRDDTMDIMENSNKSKPPLGVAPYWIVLKDRIRELARAISRYSKYIPGTESISKAKVNDLMRGWAQEIQQLLDVIDFLDEMNLSEEG